MCIGAQIWGQAPNHGMPTSGHTSKKIDSSFPYQPPSRSGVPGVPPPSMLEFLTGLTLCRSCAGKCNCHGFLSTAATLCPEDNMSNYPSLQLLHSLCSLSCNGPEPWSGHDRDTPSMTEQSQLFILCRRHLPCESDGLVLLEAC